MLVQVGLITLIFLVITLIVITITKKSGNKKALTILTLEVFICALAICLSILMLVENMEKAAILLCFIAIITLINIVMITIKLNKMQKYRKR